MNKKPQPENGKKKQYHPHVQICNHIVHSHHIHVPVSRSIIRIHKCQDRITALRTSLETQPEPLCLQPIMKI